MERKRNNALLGVVAALVILCIATQVMAFVEVMRRDYSLEALAKEQMHVPFSPLQIGLAGVVIAASIIGTVLIQKRFGSVFRFQHRVSDSQSGGLRPKTAIYVLFAGIIVVILISALGRGAIALPLYAPSRYEPGMGIYSALLLPIVNAVGAVLALWLRQKQAPQAKVASPLSALVLSAALATLMITLSIPTGNAPSWLIPLGIMGVLWGMGLFGISVASSLGAAFRSASHH